MFRRFTGGTAGFASVSCTSAGPSQSLLAGIVSLICMVLLPIPSLMAEQPKAGAPRLAIFDMELQDASHEGAVDGIRPDQEARLKLISGELRSLLDDTGKFELVDIGPAAEEIGRKGPLLYCNGCDGDIARGLGADLALTGFVYKVSNLILEIHLYVRDVKTGNIKAKMSSSIRGNTDESWLHGIRWMFRNRIKQADLGVTW